MRLRLAVFDLYGTLADVAAPVRAEDLGARGADLAWIWRQKQLEYSWLRTIAGRHADFATVTAAALDWAMARLGLTDGALRTRLLDGFHALPAHPDAAAALAAAGEAGLQRAVLSNGTPAMIAATVQAGGLARHFDALLSVEPAGGYKPLARVYDLVGTRFGTQPAEVLFVSANGWDAGAAAGYGFRSVWINRAGDPPDALWAAPALVLPDLTHLARAF